MNRPGLAIGQTILVGSQSAAVAESVGGFLMKWDGEVFPQIQERPQIFSIRGSGNCEVVRLTFKFQGLDQKPTGVEPARVVRELLA